MPDVTMPRLSDSMEEATIANWLVADGDKVMVGQELAEIETDKATVSFEAEVAGKITLLAKAGETIRLGGLIARILGADESDEAIPSPANPVPETPVPAESSPVMTTPAPHHGSPSQRRRIRAMASPLARRMAESHGVDLETVVGTGPRGRIVKADLTTRIARIAVVPETCPPPALTEPANTNGAEVATQDGRHSHGLSRTQELIARRMSQSRATIPDFDLSIEVDMEAAWELRAKLKADGADPVPSLNDIIVMACGRALAEQPNVNSAYKDGQVERYEKVNVGIAIAADNSLVVATLTDADRRPLSEIARMSRRLAARVRDGSISPAELSGATFTVSNLGMFGVDYFTAVLNAPQAAILAVGSIKERAVVREGQVISRRTAILTLAVDHRLLYGADAARFLARVQVLLEAPLSLLAG